MDEIIEFLHKYGQVNDITIRWSKSDDPESTHPERITIGWCDEAGQWWLSDVDAHAGRPGAEFLVRAITEAAREAKKP